MRRFAPARLSPLAAAVAALERIVFHRVVREQSHVGPGLPARPGSLRAALVARACRHCRVALWPRVGDETMSTFVAGLLVMGYAVAALFFLRFRRETRDRLFAFFAAAFALLALQ